MIPLFFKPLILLIFLNIFLGHTYGQEMAANTCESTLLTKKVYEKCKSDTVWTADIVINTNYIIEFKTSLLPKYRSIRKSLSIPVTLQSSLNHLRIIYDTILDKKISLFQTEIDRNQEYVQPKVYLSSLLSFQIFKFYPDIYAILLNDIHLHLKPKFTIEEQELYKQLFEKSLNCIPAELYQKLIRITNELNNENNILMEQGFTKMFQGSIQNDYRHQCDIINFLLWTE